MATPEKRSDILAALSCDRDIAAEPSILEFYRGLTAPIRSVSDDLLLETISYLAQEDRETITSFVAWFMRGETPSHYALTHVCHHWRVLIHSMPPWWSTIRVKTYRTDAAFFANVISSRSGNLKLDVRFVSDGTPLSTEAHIWKSQATLPVI